MKKFLLYLWVGVLLSLWTVSASGCFHDAINSVNKAGYITRGAYVINVACYQGGQTVIATLSAGTKVRIIGQSAYTKIVLPDGRIGRVWNDRVAETNDRGNVPAYPTNHNVQSYCDTTNPTKCPKPIPPGVPITEWYYTNDAGAATTEPPSSQTTTTNTTNTQSDVIQITDALKSKLDMMVTNVLKQVDAKYGDNYWAKIVHYQTLVTALDAIKDSAPKIVQLIDYLSDKFEEKSALLELEHLLNVD